MLSERTEFIFLEEVSHFRAVFSGQLHLLFSNVKRNVCLDGHEVVAELDMSSCVLECFFLLRGKLIDVGIDVFHIVEFADQLSGTHFADSLDTWHIVGCVAAEGKDFYHLLRPADAVFVADFLNVNQLALIS